MGGAKRFRRAVLASLLAMGCDGRNVDDLSASDAGDGAYPHDAARPDGAGGGTATDSGAKGGSAGRDAGHANDPDGTAQPIEAGPGDACVDGAARPEAGDTPPLDAAPDANAAPDADAGDQSPEGLVAVPFEGVLDSVTAVAWSESEGAFLLLEAARGRLFRLEPHGREGAALTGPFELPVGRAAPKALAVSATHAFVVVDGAVVRLPLRGAPEAGAAEQAIPLVGTVDARHITLGHAAGFLLVGDYAGPAQSLADGASAFDVWDTATVDGGRPLIAIARVASDGGRFAVRLADGVGTAIRYVEPGVFVPSAEGCLSGSLPNLAQIALSGSTLAWVLQPAVGYYQLHFATLAEGGCSDHVTVFFADSPLASSAVGLIGEGSALVIESFVYPFLDVAIYGRAAAARVGDSLRVPSLGTSDPEIVVGRRHAVIFGGRVELVAF
jgi:hypothetical protein